jgi:hypothetical protein
MNLLEDCELCYPFTLSEFPETIVIEAGLDPNEEYYFKVTDKFGNSQVTVPLTPDADGIVTIQVVTAGYASSSFINEPSPAWFNKNAGRFYIEASLATDIWEPERLWLGSEPYSEYECVVVEFVNDDSEKNVIL